MYYLGYIKSSLLFGLVPFVMTMLAGVALACGAGVLLRKSVREVAPVALAFCSVGATTGLFMGASRDGVVGAVVPAFLTFVSGLAIHQFAKRDETFEKWRYSIPLATAGMFAAAVMSAAFGAAMREHVHQNEERQAEQRLRFEKVQLPLELAKLRKQLGLSPEAPGEGAPKESPSGPN